MMVLIGCSISKFLLEEELESSWAVGVDPAGLWLRDGDADRPSVGVDSCPLRSSPVAGAGIGFREDSGFWFAGLLSAEVPERPLMMLASSRVAQCCSLA